VHRTAVVTRRGDADRREVLVSDTVLVDLADGVATITLNRPDALNSLTVEAKQALLDAVRRVADDPMARAVVLTGAGRAFCAGQDLREHQAMLDSGDPAPMHSVRDHFNPLVLGIARMPKPVIAAVNGMAAGAGASLAFAADFRIAAESARFLLAFAGIGLSLDSGASWTLPRLVGLARATAMAILAEPVGSGPALEMGLVNAVVPDGQTVPAARGLAGKLAAGPTVAYAAIKESLAFAQTATLEEALEKEAEMQARTGATQDHQAATGAFVRKERPIFIGQ
jgi:2-(1,2-epoxy-1,2-dihydrophenyl)acetyl-CoA isomerase